LYQSLFVFLFFSKKMATVLITGGAGFIGYHLSIKFIEKKYTVYALDNLQDEISGHLKYERLALLKIDKRDIVYGKMIARGNYHFIQGDLTDEVFLEDFFKDKHFDVVIHLAAQTGIRNSLKHPDIYLKNNINGFHCLLKSCIKFNYTKIIFASSSSVYGENREMPYKEDFRTDNPGSIYAFTKKANELMAQTYVNLHKITAVGLRFFTVYGPWGRTDMAPYIFIKSIREGRTISLYNNGESLRDFTYVDDVVKSIFLISQKISDTHFDTEPYYSIFNVGNSKPIVLKDFLSSIERILSRKAAYVFMPIQGGDITATYASVEKLNNFIGFKPDTCIEEGLKKTIEWYIKLSN